MQRVLSFYLKMWPIDLVRRRDRSRVSANGTLVEPRETPAILLVTTSHGREIVTRCCEQALAVGVRSGMTLSHARALFGRQDIRVEPDRPQRDAAALRALATWATRFSPLVAPDPPDGLFIDITGCQRVFRGERRLVQRVNDAVRDLGLHLRIACADTFGCAWAMARCGHESSCIVPSEEERRVLAPLPVAALRIDADTVDSLDEVGIESIGHLFAIPRGQLAARFGHDLLLRLDQATGEAFETINPVRPAPPLMVHRCFNGGATQIEAIEITIQHMLAELAAELRRMESGIRTLEVELARLDAVPVRFVVNLSRPNRSVRHLWSLLQPRVEDVNLGFGVEAITLTAIRTGRLRHEQARQLDDPGSLDDAQTGRLLGEMVDTLVDRVGADRVRRLEPVETHLPERAFRSRSIVEPVAAKMFDAALACGDRPSVLFDRPHEARVMARTPDGPLLWLRSGEVEHRIMASIGPERLAPEWWRMNGRSMSRRSITSCATRDYFKVQDARGCWLWVYRELQTGRWFIHGQWA